MVKIFGNDMSHSYHPSERGISNKYMCCHLAVGGLIALIWLSGCAPLQPVGEPEGTDLQVTVDSLKSAVRDGQRMTADLRIELADRRKELADVHVARAQLQGMLRETENRLAEARHIIELQREELVAARVDREHVEESGRQLHSRLRRLEKLLAQARRQGDIIPSAYVPRHSAELTQPVHVSPQEAPLVAPMTADPFSADPIRAASKDPQSETESSHIIVVREGETLWRLARRHRVGLEELRQINGLQDDRIVTGWTLRLPVPTRTADMRASGPQLMER
jgi:LysM repeat protein